MFGNFFKDRIIDWEAILAFVLFGVIIAVIIGWLGFCVWCFNKGFMFCGAPVGGLVFSAPFAVFAGYVIIDMCFPKDHAEANRRRARRLEKAARKAEVRMRRRAMKRQRLTDYDTCEECEG